MERRPQIDILRAFAILGVILIHIVGVSLYVYPKGSTAASLLITIDQLSRFCVPLFVAISGYTLVAKYQTKKLELAAFYKRRVARIIPTYLLATLIIYLYLNFVSPWSQIKNPYPLWQIFLIGRADYHLYFIPMILQLYLLFPAFLYLLKKSKVKTIVLAAAIQIITFASAFLASQKLLTLPFPWGDQQQYLFFGSWVFYFVLGMLLANQNRINRVVKIVVLVTLVLGFPLVLFQTISQISAGADVISQTRFTRFSIFLLATALILICNFYGENLLKLPKIAVKILTKIGALSFSIYLVHTIAIRIMLLNIDVYPISSLLLFSIGSLIASLIFAWIFEEALTLTKKSVQALLPDKDL